MSDPSAWRVCLLLTSLAIGVGCGGDAAVAPVAGTLTLDGQPLAGATITTQPIATDTDNPGSGSFATTDDQGRFVLELVKPAQKGAVVGEHRVMISPPDSAAGGDQSQRTSEGLEVWTDDPNSAKAAAASARKWPVKFSDGSLRLNVPPAGNTEVRIELSR
ncbi:MAG: hypothetical protein DCC67_17540 [Planctomycetota bacterium]|nr:MAG: hypothetical protein DCC67_17540 [Planctomycetota bacterium]